MLLSTSQPYLNQGYHHTNTIRLHTSPIHMSEALNDSTTYTHSLLIVHPLMWWRMCCLSPVTSPSRTPHWTPSLTPHWTPSRTPHWFPSLTLHWTPCHTPHWTSSLTPHWTPSLTPHWTPSLTPHWTPSLTSFHSPQFTALLLSIGNFSGHCRSINKPALLPAPDQAMVRLALLPTPDQAMVMVRTADCLWPGDD